MFASSALVSPFVSLQAGIDIDVSNVGVGIHVNPAVGLDISRFSINFGYDMRYGVWKHGKGIDNHYFKIGVGVTIL